MSTSIHFNLETYRLLERLVTALEQIAKAAGQHWTCPGCGSANPQQHGVNCNWALTYQPH